MAKTPKSLPLTQSYRIKACDETSCCQRCRSYAYQSSDLAELHFHYEERGIEVSSDETTPNIGQMMRKDNAFHKTLIPALARILPRYSLKQRLQICLLSA